jgi:hypothetical protein
MDAEMNNAAATHTQHKTRTQTKIIRSHLIRERGYFISAQRQAQLVVLARHRTSCRRSSLCFDTTRHVALVVARKKLFFFL